MRKLIIAAILLVPAACDRGGSASGDTANAPNAPPKMTITTPEGKTEIRTGGGTAAGLPEGIPAYPGADTTGGLQISGTSAQGAGAIQGFRTSDPPDRVIDFYAGAAERAGFRIAARVTTGGGTAMLTAQRGKETVNISASGVEGATQVQIIAANER